MREAVHLRFARQAETAWSWREKLASDARVARDLQTEPLRRTTRAVVAQARDAGAAAIVLTGSTARGQRTSISDIDYYVIGDQSFTHSSDEDVDIFRTSLEGFIRRLRAGEDYAHWTLRFGCVLYDSGPIRRAVGLVGRRGLQPSPRAQLPRLRRALERGEAILATEDHDAADDQVRELLSLAARWLLLSAGVFPLARRELPMQLNRIGEDAIAAFLARSIAGGLSRDDSGRALSAVKELVELDVRSDESEAAADDGA